MDDETFDPAEAREELMHHTADDLHRDAALIWAGRAQAAYGFALGSDGEERAEWRHDGDVYGRQAVHHADHCEDDRLLDAISTVLVAGRDGLEDLRARP